MEMRRAGCLLLATAYLLAATGCAAPQAAAQPTAEEAPAAQATDAPLTHYTPPPLATAEYHAEAAEQFGDVGEIGIDTSCAAQGYVAVSAQSEAALKFQVVCGESTYNYDLPGDGTPTVYVLQSGSAHYQLRVMQNVSGTKYAELAATELDVALESEFAPFLRPSQMVSYDENAACVKKADELIADAASDADAVAKIYQYICDNITYDTAKALSIQADYLPDPDATLAQGKGICFDYASLAAAMLRSQGIPTKLITGYVSPDDLYHAWNMIYLQDEGWITVTLQAPAHEWQRIDLTFAAGGGDFAGDGSSYTDRYVY